MTGVSNGGTHCSYTSTGLGHWGKSVSQGDPCRWVKESLKAVRRGIID